MGTTHCVTAGGPSTASCLTTGGLRRSAHFAPAGTGLSDSPDCAGVLRGVVSTYEWKSIYGSESLYAGPLFIHQMSHIWCDLRGIRDRFMRERLRLL
jgi:hypothetical protein